MAVKIVEGDLLDFKVQYIVHQTNCISSGAAGLACWLFEKYPWANIYHERTIGRYRHIPGNIYIRKDEALSEPHVINAMGQFIPGGPGEAALNNVRYEETAKMRAAYFISCLQKIMKINDLKSIAFPYKIGCGNAEGDWEYYQKLINSFADKVPNVEVFIVKRPGDN
jgi:O-acetyl-ADP-ribose deacetylase (regulator of RNase III)